MTITWDDLGEDEEEVPEKFNAMALARYFRKLYKKAEWNTYGVINMVAFAAQLKQWENNSDSATIMNLMDHYFDDVTLRGKNPGWKDFIYQANFIAAKLKSRQTNDWDAYTKEWEKKHGVAL